MSDREHATDGQLWCSMGLALMLTVASVAAILLTLADWSLAWCGAGLALTEGDSEGFWLETGVAVLGATWLLCRLGRKPWEL